MRISKLSYLDKHVLPGAGLLIYRDHLTSAGNPNAVYFQN